jgi:hypothetical protein
MPEQGKDIKKGGFLSPPLKFKGLAPAFCGIIAAAPSRDEIY